MTEKETKPAISISSLVLPNKEVEFDFPGCDGFSVTLNYMGRPEIQKLLKKCTTIKFDPKTRQPIEKVDEDKFIELFSSEVLKGWKGLKVSYLNNLVLVDTSEVSPNTIVSYNTENAVSLMRESSVFVDWVNAQLEDLENFTKSK